MEKELLADEPLGPGLTLVTAEAFAALFALLAAGEGNQLHPENNSTLQTMQCPD